MNSCNPITIARVFKQYDSWQSKRLVIISFTGTRTEAFIFNFPHTFCIKVSFVYTGLHTVIFFIFNGVIDDWMFKRSTLTNAVEPPNAKEAVKWLYQASVAGYVRGQYQLALCLHRGIGTDQNLSEAVCCSLSWSFMSYLFMILSCILHFRNLSLISLNIKLLYPPSHLSFFSYHTKCNLRMVAQDSFSYL
jgi:hypothetical protein